MNQNLKTALTTAMGIAVGFIVFTIIKRMIDGKLSTPEAKANASGILCYCRRPNGTIKVQECRGSKYTTCDECCGHYGFDNDVASGF